MGKNRKKLFFVPLGLLAVFIAGFVSSQLLNIVSARNSSERYPLLSKRIFIENPNDVRLDFRELRLGLLSDIENRRYGEIPISDVSLYFEYLPSGVSININQDMELVAASLMKTAVVMQLYKVIERGDIQLDQQVTITEEMLDSRYGTLYKEGTGNVLTVQEIIEKTLTESDNTASNAIKTLTYDKINIEDLGQSIDLKRTIDSDGRLFLSAKSYSAVFKCLYFACYINQAHSQEILDYLTRTVFTDRLTNLLPDSVTTAHKIGTFNDEHQSDCGIIYSEDREANYLLCVMVRGADPEASLAIARMSYKVYTYLNNL